MTEIELPQIPQKEQYKLSEVCEYTDTQPYVLRFWESEFPQLNPDKSRGGQSIYSREELDLVLRIKQLLNDEEHTLEGARHRLERESGDRSSPARRGAQRTKPVIAPPAVPLLCVP